MSLDRRWISAGVLALALAACSEPGSSPLEPASRPSQLESQYSLNNPSPVECPSSVTQSTSALIGPLGGSLSVGGSSVVVPAGAVLLPTSITLTIPASNYMEIDVSAGGVDHYVFQTPVSMTIDYSRCTRNDIDQTPLSIWYWNPSANELLENMGGTDDKTARKVTFTTLHLSGYVIAD
jgi:hypothetical protein